MEKDSGRLIPALTLLPETMRRIDRVSLDTFCGFGLRDHDRIDPRPTEARPQVTDMNANRNIILGSSFVQVAEQGGYAYSATLDWIVRMAWERAKRQRGGR